MFKLHDQSSAAAAKRTPDSKSNADASNADAQVVRAPAQEAPHPASRFDAGTGQGTLSEIPQGKTLDHPVLDGATESSAAQSATRNPFRGRRDPAMGEWNYSHAHVHEDEMDHEPERKIERDADAARHANDLEPRHWYKYDPFREERNRMKSGGAGPAKAM